jgi:hypothetical protein
MIQTTFIELDLKGLPHFGLEYWDATKTQFACGGRHNNNELTI